MSRLPITGQDQDKWGDILNDYLKVAHNDDGTLKDSLIMKVFNIKEYGAAGDGTTDDRAAIQAAIDGAEAAGGGIVFVPHGKFAVDPGVGLHLKNKTYLMGAGRSSVLIVPNGANTTGNMVKVESKTDVIVAHLMLDGNRSQQSSGTNYGLFVSGSDNCRVTNVWTNNFTGVGNHVYDCDGVTISDCIATNNFYHGFECEQARGCVWKGNRGYGNDRHGIFVSPGEIGGSGSKGNSIIGNSFDANGQYGIAIGVAAAPGSESLASGNIIAHNSVRNNAHYGISLYHQDGTIMVGNAIEGNGYFGVYAYKSRDNQIVDNQFHNNSQAANNAYDEIMLEGSADGRASQNNLIAGNMIRIDGAVKARYAIGEATNSDGPNVITNNIIPNSGITGTVQVRHPGTLLSSPAGVQQVRGGQAIPGQNAGIDNAFNILRLYSNLANAEVQVVSTTGGIKFWSNGTERFMVNADGMIVANTDRFRIATAKTPVSASAAGDTGQIAWDANYMYVCVSPNTWKRTPLASW